MMEPCHGEQSAVLGGARLRDTLLSDWWCDGSPPNGKCSQSQERIRGRVAKTPTFATQVPAGCSSSELLPNCAGSGCVKAFISLKAPDTFSKLALEFLQRRVPQHGSHPAPRLRWHGRELQQCRRGSQKQLRLFSKLTPTSPGSRFASRYGRGMLGPGLGSPRRCLCLPALFLFPLPGTCSDLCLEAFPGCGRLRRSLHGARSGCVPVGRRNGLGRVPQEGAEHLGVFPGLSILFLHGGQVGDALQGLHWPREHT